jgi:hypothetical protein
MTSAEQRSDLDQETARIRASGRVLAAVSSTHIIAQAQVPSGPNLNEAQSYCLRARQELVTGKNSAERLGGE